MDICGAADVPSTPGDNGSVPEAGPGIVIPLERAGTVCKPESTTSRRRGGQLPTLSEAAETIVLHNNSVCNARTTPDKETSMEGTSLQDNVSERKAERGSTTGTLVDGGPNAMNPPSVQELDSTPKPGQPKMGLQHGPVKEANHDSPKGELVDDGPNLTNPQSTQLLAASEKPSLPEKSAGHASAAAKTRKRKSRNVAICGTTVKRIKEGRSGGTAFNIDDLVVPNGFKGHLRRKKP